VEVAVKLSDTVRRKDAEEEADKTAVVEEEKVEEVEVQEADERPADRLSLVAFISRGRVCDEEKVLFSEKKVSGDAEGVKDAAENESRRTVDKLFDFVTVRGSDIGRETAVFVGELENEWDLDNVRAVDAKFLRGIVVAINPGGIEADVLDVPLTVLLCWTLAVIVDDFLENDDDDMEGEIDVLIVTVTMDLLRNLEAATSLVNDELSNDRLVVGERDLIETVTECDTDCEGEKSDTVRQGLMEAEKGLQGSCLTEVFRHKQCVGLEELLNHNE
jgi:hypothetical protein